MRAKHHEGITSAVQKAAGLRVSLGRSQFFTGESVTLSCEDRDISTGWILKRRTTRSVSQCGHDFGDFVDPNCTMSYLVSWDTGAYWCESKDGVTSGHINLTISGPGSKVLLQSPVHPVTEGQDVVLSCHTNNAGSNTTASFYRDHNHLMTTPTGHMTLRNVSRSDEGFYKCTFSSHGESPPNWISITGVEEREEPSGGRHKTPTNKTAPFVTAKAPPTCLSQSVVKWLCLLVAFCPYLISTVLVVSLYRARETGSSTPDSTEKEENRK
ncbi:uncharacterized protein LOC114471111 isoform X2 [Gouania willdenowi]|uniref:uncharacterized protein LOC114471111 isoform X2 n=1 Tax=Gouania willdenowi TaxID=441366 RepID=UPI0010542CA8|nr:uncharacterized protein LOC114471111 isoform X2 [Gouania willdenowi]